jgi:predicted DNA-binding transcriptional regulator AlpA
MRDRASKAELVSASELRQRVGLSMPDLHNWIASGRCPKPYVKTSGNMFWKAESVAAFIAEFGNRAK